ncbi:MAG: type I DNA topoisomerase [bacterium]
MPASEKKKTAAKSTAARRTRAAAPAKKHATAAKSTAARKTSAAARAGYEDDDSSASGKSLVVVESPAKAKTLGKYLGPQFKIEASIGHVKDLPTSKLGVDIDKGFEPHYVVLKGKEKVIGRICRDAAVATQIYLAPDPDREGEAIAWHIADELRRRGVKTPVHRAAFNEITRRAVQEAIEHPQEINLQLFEAQQARRILDRLVGYKISPLLWTKVSRGLSAGRVQSVAVRLIVGREREIEAFIPQEFWTIEAQVEAAVPPPFEMRLAQVDGRKPQLGGAIEARALFERLGAQAVSEITLDQENTRGPQGPRKALRGRIGYPWTVASVETKDVSRHPSPPFITSTIQQEAARKLGFGAKKTMTTAQRLYEGVELGSDGMTALITYMRTDSTRISDDAIRAARACIAQTYGENYLPHQPNFYRTKKGAQDAHEAIRPTDMQYDPARVAPFLDKDQRRLYTLIWNRFIACQMADAIFEQTKIDSLPREGLLFNVTGLVQKFAGFLAVYEEDRDEAEGENGKTGKLPPVKQGDALAVNELRGVQRFTIPPPRYTEASLVKELERRGIGRPSTYATIVSIIQDKEYVNKDTAKRFRPTELGYIVTDLLVEHFPEVMDVEFTARMEEKLDEVEEGVRDWRALLDEFYCEFKDRLESAQQNMKSVKRQEIPTVIPCDKCGQANMVVKWGRNGQFLACPRYPECKNAKPYKEQNGQPAAQEIVESDEVCDNCGRRLVVKNGRHGRFLACPGYPECKNAKPYKTGVKCPLCGDGDFAERMSKNSKIFYSCTNYPRCKNTLWTLPMPRPCPACGNPFMLKHENPKRATLHCPNKDCGHVEALSDAAGAAPGGDDTPHNGEASAPLPEGFSGAIDE